MDSPPFPPAVIAAARTAAKAHLRIGTSDEDDAIDTMAATALALAEAFTGRALIVRDFAEMLHPRGQWQALTAVPVSAITAVDAGDAADGTGALPPGSYAIDIDADGTGRIRVHASLGTPRVRVTYAAGMTLAWETLPAPIAQGVVLLIAHLFDHRDGNAVPPASVSALWRPWRRMRLAAGKGAA